MTEAILVEGISKKFKIGLRRRDTMLRERLIKLLVSPFKAKPAERDEFWALRDISFSIPEGEAVGIIGRNGAGKSTLLKILSKITYPTLGRIRTSGRLAALLEVGTGFHQELTGRENVYLNASLLGMKRREVQKKFDAIVSFAGVEQFLDTPIKRYSTGMRVRLGFAVAAHLDPEILIVDEVLSVGDAAFQKRCLNTVGELRSGGRTVLFVSHNMAAVENLCTRGIWLEGGHVKADGPAQSVIKKYMVSTAATGQSSVDLGAASRRVLPKIYYKRMEILSPEGVPQPVTRSGDAVVLRLHFTAQTQISYPYFGVKLTSDLGVLIAAAGTWFHRLDFPVVEAGDGYLDLCIDCLSLLPGRYYFSLSITGTGGEVYDAVEQCVTLDVEPSDIFGGGREVDSRYGLVYFPQRWRTEGVRVPPSGLQIDETGALGTRFGS